MFPYLPILLYLLSGMYRVLFSDDFVREQPSAMSSMY